MAKKKGNLERLKQQGRALGEEVSRRGERWVEEGQKLAREGAASIGALATGRRKAKKKSVAAKVAGGVAAVAAGAAAVAGALVVGGRRAGGERGERSLRQFRVTARDEGWVVQDGSEISSRHATKKEAVAAGRAAARDGAPSELVIEDASGRRQTSHTYE